MLLMTNWTIDCHGVYNLESLKDQETGKTFNLSELLEFSEQKYYVDNLDRFAIYFLSHLLTNGYTNAESLETCKINQFWATMRNGACNSFFVNHKGKKSFYNFKTKFGIDFGGLSTNIELINYADDNNRKSASLGADAYNEFLHTIFRPKKNPNANKKLMRQDYPIINCKILDRAKEFVCGYQLATQGDYKNIYSYDQTSAFPSQLTNRTPTGAPIVEFKDIAMIPKNYWYVVDLVYYSLELKSGHDWLNLAKRLNHGHLYLTKELHQLFLETYNATIIVKSIVAFKTIRGRFDKFIEKNIINGKINQQSKVVAKYNKCIANSLIGYCGRNTTVTNNIFTWTHNICVNKVKRDKIDPIYLPLFLYVNGKQKAEFIRTINNIDGLIYANTDGFLTTKPINLDHINARFTDNLGAFVKKPTYQVLHIECINGYAGIDEYGEIDNTISGMTLKQLISPEQYATKSYTYDAEYATPDLKVVKMTIAARECQ